MSKRIPIKYLCPDGTYRTTKGDFDLGPFFFTGAKGKKVKGQYHSLIQEPIFHWGKVVQFQSWDEFKEKMSEPKAELPLKAYSGKPMILCPDHGFWPVSALPTRNASLLKEEVGIAYKLRATQINEEEANKTESTTLRWGFMILVAAACIMAIALSAMLLPKILEKNKDAGVTGIERPVATASVPKR